NHRIEDLLVKHFSNRFPGKQVVIVNEKFGVAFTGENGRLNIVSQNVFSELLNEIESQKVEEKETDNQLWDTFYDSQFIESRRSRKRCLKFIPKKIWKQFPETETRKMDKGIPNQTLKAFV
ncbi:MAG: DUF4130 domain-containing protein, partial [archaeon]